MYELVKSPLSKDDLKGIWHYSRKKWGDDKAIEYLLQIDSGILGLTSNPKIGKSYDHIRTTALFRLAVMWSIIEY